MLITITSINQNTKLQTACNCSHYIILSSKK
nr:MAG TPA: hypothetical protein [Caudoviricetes sp.]